MALTDNMALFSAYANDDGYENVFVEQLANFVRPGDIVIGISTSGNSLNVLKAVNFAREAGAITIGWIGFEGGMLARIVDVPVIIPNHSVEQLEDLHLMLEHLVATALRRAIEEGIVLPGRGVAETWALRLVERIYAGREATAG
jgi:D-sedoheptulose 7-phosphate isomerase